MYFSDKSRIFLDFTYVIQVSHHVLATISSSVLLPVVDVMQSNVLGSGIANIT